MNHLEQQPQDDATPVKRVRTDVANPVRQRLYRRAILVAIVGNALLAGAKALVAWMSGSSAVFSDAANSLSDMLYSLLMGLGLFLAQQPPDESHPQGHSRFEPFVGLFIAAAMGAAGVTAIWRGIERFLQAGQAIAPGWPTMVLGSAAVVKFGMYLVVKRLGQQARSPAILASARDNMADILASLAALLGVWGSRYLHPLFDPAAGCVVALWIFRNTWEIVWENIGYLTGRGASHELTDTIMRAALEIPGVIDVHRIIAEYVGPRLRVDMHINTDGKISLEHAHAIGEQVRERIEALPDVDLVFIHIEPPHDYS